MRVGLMVPCYIDMFYSEVGVATLEPLEKLGVGRRGRRAREDVLTAIRDNGPAPRPRAQGAK